MYINYEEYVAGRELVEGDSVLMSLAEFEAGGKDLRGVPLTVTLDGSEPKDEEEGPEQDDMRDYI